MESRKNKFNKFILGCAFLFLFGIIIYSCNNTVDSTINNNTNPGILKVDETGRIIFDTQNDWSDWCFDTLSYSGLRSHLYGAYPNPTDSVVYINFEFAANDSAAMYFLKSNTDTAFVFRKRAFSAGYYQVEINRHNYDLGAGYQRVYLINKNGLTATSKPCNNFGDILFTK